MLNEKTVKIIIAMKYEEEGIGGVIELINEIDKGIETFSTNCKDDDWIKFVGTISAKFQMLDSLITMKILQNQREDLKAIGSYLQNLGKELIDYKIDKTPKKKDKIDEAVDNLFDVLFGEGED